MAYLDRVSRYLFDGRLMRRIEISSKYLYHHLIDRFFPALSLERPRVEQCNNVDQENISDITSSIEFYLVDNEQSHKVFCQPDEDRQSKVMNIENKFKTKSCFICSNDLEPVVEVINRKQWTDKIQISWCPKCDYLQYSEFPSKDWFKNWYGNIWDAGGSIDEKLVGRPISDRAYRRIKSYLPRRQLKILDIGAGYGEKTKPFVMAGHEVHCTEATSRRAEFLRQHVTPHVYYGALDDLSVKKQLIKNGPFDLVFSYHVIEHIYDAPHELQLINEITSANALFYLAIPELYKEGIMNNIYAMEHISSFSRVAAKKLLEKCGFEAIVDRDDLFQYYNNYCQYLIGRKSSKLVTQAKGQINQSNKMHEFLESALQLSQISSLSGNCFRYKTSSLGDLTYLVSNETKEKCKNPEIHFPIKIYHNALPLFWI
jgi:2-polyprenyl-3-methyl-5-hydroxy-6-metoxy-1,4-benzoquinol methylase